ncbi:hypothetical protein WOLCODRAFT_138945 [Wolfiporia cocos MD-104 SS10]|uniref:Uncharacterized protein n=1 Tax=Wolfiporia cocos (strain MD-104) TaxID=742152 RepID=A0A2H3K2H2_WOLCO|nr:hypothetical protein WOLCODRAFT_138945 [Wolfiporia cocos MD-104 SS10]
MEMALRSALFTGYASHRLSNYHDPSADVKPSFRHEGLHHEGRPTEDDLATRQSHRTRLLSVLEVSWY